MKAIPTVLLALLFVGVFCTSPKLACAQTAPQATPGTSRQWVSHQMNQPPPDSGSRYQLSDAMIEEIRQLFLQAQKELDSRPDKQKSTP